MVYVILPNSGQSLGITRPAINQNFSIIQNAFALNHYDFNSSIAIPGKHSFVQMPVQTTPTILLGEGALYTNTVNSTSQLFYKRDVDAADYQVTGPNLIAPSGYAFIPGGIVIQWGFTTPGATSGTITTPYTPVSTSNLYSVVASQQASTPSSIA